MKVTYTLGECCAALHVDFKTFKKWLEKDNVQASESEYDGRIKYLTAEQVQVLAMRHSRPWPPVLPEPETITPTEAKRLLEQIAIAARQAEQARRDHTTLRGQAAQVEQQAKQISAEHDQLRDDLSELREQRETTARQLAGIEQAQREQAGQIDTQAREAQEQSQQLAVRLDALKTTTEQQTSELAQQAKQQGGELAQQTEKLAELAEQIRQQGEQVGQLIGQLDKQARQAKEAQASATKQIEAAEQRLQAQFQAALTALRREMSEEYERRAQGIEAEQARDMAALTKQSEQLTGRLKSVTSAVEEAKTTAASGQSASTEQDVRLLQQQLQAERSARADLEAIVNRLVKAQEQQPTAQPEESQATPARKPRGRKPKQSTGGDPQP